MVVFIATLYVQESRLDEFKGHCRELIDLTVKHEPDALIYELVQSVDNPLKYCWYARFRDQAAFDLHMTSEYHDTIIPPLLDCLSQEMELEFFSDLEA